MLIVIDLMGEDDTCNVSDLKHELMSDEEKRKIMYEDWLRKQPMLQIVPVSQK